jgi:hypothetical protein
MTKGCSTGKHCKSGTLLVGRERNSLTMETTSQMGYRATERWTKGYQERGLRAGGTAQVVQCLPSKSEALSSNSSAAKNKTPQKNRCAYV